MKALFAALPLLIWGQVQTPQTKQIAPFWTAAEKKEYQACIPVALNAWGDPKSHRTPKQVQKIAEDDCLVEEEHKRWLRLHPEAKTEDKSRMQSCLRANSAKINGTKEEFRIAFDGCMSEAYGSKEKLPFPTRTAR